jgi:Macrocin-O-methyltransferase (TylF)
VGRDGQLYLELLKKVLTNVIYQDVPHRGWDDRENYDPAARAEGRDWPTVAHTMVGRQRLDNVHMCMDQVLADGIPGDFIETGAWRGGVCIFMRAVLEAYGCVDRTVWVADSFQGIPESTGGSHPLDQEMALHRANDVLAVPVQVVRENFRRYGLLDDQVKFLSGWFKDSLPEAPIDRLAVLRLDGDLYESTTDALENLYPKLSTGGFVIVDDYAIPGCRDAVHDFRRKRDVEDPIQTIDYTGVYWRRTAAAEKQR